MADIDVTQLPSYLTPTSSDILIVIKNADDSLNNTTIGQLLSLVSVPSAYTSNPAALGTASPGSSTAWARGDHVHAKPSASDVGAVAVAQGVGHAGEFLVVGSDGNVTTVTLATWQCGSY